MTRLLAVLFAVLSLAACGESERVWPDPKPALWEVQGPEGERGWLFGTIHALPDNARWRTPMVERALGGAGILVVEIADLQDSAKAAALFDALDDTAGLPPLSRRVSPGDRADLADLIERAGMKEADLSGMETWAAAIVLANRARGDRAARSVDSDLIAGNKPVLGLETFESQFGIFDRLPPHEQADLLMALARDAPGDTRIENWLTGDLAALERDGGEGLLADPELRDALQLARNRAWAPVVERLLRDGRKPFVAVGTAHMFGEEGLPALLARAGFAVRRVQ